MAHQREGKPMKSKKKIDSYHHGALRASLAEKAVQLIAKRGHVDFNMRELAKKCDVSAAAVYRHFKSKDALLIEIAQIGFANLLNDLQRVSQELPNLKNKERLERIGLAYVEFAINHEGFFRTMFGRELCSLPEFGELQGTARKTLEVLETALMDLKNKPTKKKNTGKENSLSASGKASVLRAWALVHGLSHLWIGQNTKLNKKEFSALVAKILSQQKF